MWSEMVTDGQRRSDVVRNGNGWSEAVRRGQRKPEVATGVQVRPKEAIDVQRWSKLDKESYCGECTLALVADSGRNSP